MIVNCPELEYDEIIIAIKSHMRDSSMLQSTEFMHKIYWRYFIYEYYARSHKLYNLPSIIRNDNERRFLIGLYKNHLSKKIKKCLMRIMSDLCIVQKIIYVHCVS